MNIISTNEPTIELAKELGFQYDEEGEYPHDDVEAYLAQQLVNINGEWLAVKNIHTYSYAPLAELEDGTEWYFFLSHEAASEEAREYWEDMAQDDPSEFTAMVGEKTLVAWALGQWAGPGSRKVKNLEEWLDLWLDTPEDVFAQYDGREVQPVSANYVFAEALGFSDFDNVVCYRHN
jgi:hypothetical protein